MSLVELNTKLESADLEASEIDAAFADHHFHVEKTELAGRTETHVRKLTGTARKDELARMLGGQATSKAKAHAAELLAEAARTDASAATAKKPRARA